MWPWTQPFNSIHPLRIFPCRPWLLLLYLRLSELFIKNFETIQLSFKIMITQKTKWLKNTKMTRFLSALLVLGLTMAGFAFGMVHSSRPDMRPPYSGSETLRYSVSWLGMPAGEVVMRIEEREGGDNKFLISATFKSAGLLDLFYPVDDYFETIVKGKSHLPEYCKMLQKEGRRQNNKVTLYDQQKYLVTYKKNDRSPELFDLDGPMHNEFSSFLFMRTLSFDHGEREMMPIFADNDRHEMVLTVEGEDTLQTIIGRKETLRVRTHLTFRGLYDKMDDPLIWLTDDVYRIPVKIRTKIAIGSLVAELSDYQGRQVN